ncbi:MAG: GatB/YqeY domain-containing protein [Bacteroidetes bacterium]|nr:GatB/YqeY domain-containing protein [Bacteroidota bacterium]
MNLKDKINADLKDAMKAGNKIRLETIRSIRALILEFEKSGTGKEMSPEDEISLLSSASKKRKDAVEQYENAGRKELAEKESAELEIIQSYLPEQLAPAKLFDQIKELAAELNAVTKQDFKILMPKAAQKFKGKADGKLIKEIVEKVLG